MMRTSCHIILGLFFVSCSGCFFGASGPDKPAFDPAGSAEQALATYDTNSDGAIDDEEVEASPGLKAAFKNIDKDGDGNLTAEEIAARISYYKSAPTTIIQGMTRVKYKRRLLEGATVTFEPEEFLGEAFSVCSGVTNEDGIASIKGHDAGFPGIYLGFYRVRITKEVKGKELLPAKYNEETELGYEAQDDMNIGMAEIINFNLK
jgi:hypothetical protein